MDSRPRYEPLRTEEEDLPAQTVDLAMVEEPPLSDEHQLPPPAYDGCTSDDMAPPSYNIATDLPTYAEAERTKKEMKDYMTQPGHGLHQPYPGAGYSTGMDQHVNGEGSISSSGGEEVQLGTDCVFMLAFITCFMFNWFGLIAVLCVVHTVAGRYGALSGFGLSMVKWALIIKSNDWAGDHISNDSWLWWLFICLGSLLCLKGIVQYFRIRAQWPELAHNRRTAFYYFY